MCRRCPYNSVIGVALARSGIALNNQRFYRPKSGKILDITCSSRHNARKAIRVGRVPGRSLVAGFLAT